MEPMNILILCYYTYSVSTGYPKTSSHPFQCYIQITPCSACLLHVITIIYYTAEDVRDAVSSLQIRDSCHVRSIIIRYKMN